MSAFDAWQVIIRNWGSAEWQPIPAEVQKVLHLDTRLGMCHCSLVTQMGAKGMNAFIDRMNAPRKL